MEIPVQRNTDAPVRNSTSGSAVLARDKTAAERISKWCSEGRDTLSPTPLEGARSPALSVCAGVIDWPGLIPETGAGAVELAPGLPW